MIIVRGRIGNVSTERPSTSPSVPGGNDSGSPAEGSGTAIRANTVLPARREPITPVSYTHLTLPTKLAV